SVQWRHHTTKKRQNKSRRARGQGVEEAAKGCRAGERYIKKGSSHLLQGRLSKYIFIKDHMDIFPVEKMSVVLKVSSSGFYKWLTRPKSNRELRTESLSDQIRIEY